MSDLSNTLQQEVDRAVRRLRGHTQASRVLSGTSSARILASYYATAHETVRHAPEFLRRSCATLRREGGHPDLIELLHCKATEETGHERWLADDLEAIGCALGSTPWLRPNPAGTVYNAFHYSVVDVCGEAFLGTAYALESLSVHCAGLAADNLRAHAIVAGIARGSNAGLSFFSSHYEADIDHVAQLRDLIERCVIEPRARDYIRLCAAFTASIYPDFFTTREANES